MQRKKRVAESFVSSTGGASIGRVHACMYGVELRLEDLEMRDHVEPHVPSLCEWQVEGPRDR